MARDAAPQSYPEFRAWYEAKLDSGEMYLTEEARYIGYATAFEIPMPWRRSTSTSRAAMTRTGSICSCLQTTNKRSSWRDWTTSARGPAGRRFRP